MGGPSLEGALALGEDAERRRCGCGEAARGLGVMSRASTCLGIAPWLTVGAVGHRGLEKPSWGHSELPLAGDGDPGCSWTPLCLWAQSAVWFPWETCGCAGAGGDTQAGTPSCASPGGLWCLLSPSGHSEQPEEGCFSCCRGIWALGTGGQSCLHLPHAGLGGQLGSPQGCGLWTEPRHHCCE